MKRRERLERKAERREGWAESAERKSTAAFDTAHAAVVGIPFGQPILVGHHSERGHRAAIDKMSRNMDKSCELAQKAKDHSYKAATLKAALDKTIFSDDDDATEALEARIAEREGERERMKDVNALYRKGDAEGLKAYGLDYENLKARLNSPNTLPWCRQPYPAYELQNLGGRITADRKRLEHIKQQQNRHAAAAESEPGLTIKRNGEYASVTFAEKPERSILNDLRESGFRWGAGYWWGHTAKLPASVLEMAGETPEPEPPAPVARVAKTMQGWHEDGRDLGKYLSVGDLVAEDIYTYCLEVLPPRTRSVTLLQMGEPASTVRGRKTWGTLRREPDGWVYAGNCYAGEREEPATL
jgi:hypothetical protein